MAWQLWHLTEIFSAFQPRWSSGMPRKAAAKSCSTITSAPEASSSAWAGETVPQNGQTRAFLAGFHCDSPPQEGQENFFLAVASGISRKMLIRLIAKRKHRQGNDCQGNGKKTIG